MERGEMREGEVKMRVQPEHGDLAEVGRVQVRDHMEQQADDFARDALERTRELIGIFGGKDRLVADRLLRERHHVVDVLWGGHPRLLALLVEPEVHPGAVRRARKREKIHSLVYWV